MNRVEPLIAVFCLVSATVLASTPVEGQEQPPPQHDCTIEGTSGADWLLGTEGDDVICGLGGDDVIRALSGNDVIYSGPGEDIVDLGGGRDVHVDENADDKMTDDKSFGATLAARGIHSVATDGLGAVPELKQPEVPPVDDAASTWSEARRAAAMAFRSDLGFETTSWAELVASARENGSALSVGAPFTNLEMAEMARRTEARNAAAGFLRSIQDEKWYSGHYVDHQGGGAIVVNVPAGSDGEAKRLLASSEAVASSVELRPVSRSLRDLEAEHEAKVRELEGDVNNSDRRLRLSFDPQDYLFKVTIETSAERRAAGDDAAVADAVAGKVSELDDAVFRFDGWNRTSDFSDWQCNAVECHILEPALAMVDQVGPQAYSFCTVGWIVIRYGAKKALSADHCGSSDYYVKGGNTNSTWPSWEAVQVVRENGSNYGNTSTLNGSDVRTFDIRDNSRGGFTDHEALNAVLKSPTHHSDIVTQIASASTSYASVNYGQGDIVCMQGMTTMAIVGNPPTCGIVTDLGDLGPGSWDWGYVDATAFACGGDSGGPVWIPAWYWEVWQADAISAAGVIHGGVNAQPFGSTGAECSAQVKFTDMGRALDDTNSDFYTPGGDQASRRIAIRWYDVFFDRSPDYAGITGWSNIPCAGNAPDDIAFRFTVTQSTEFKNRFPLNGGTVAYGQAKLRVEALYQGLFDTQPTNNDLTYWGGFIWDNPASQEADREARYEYVAWQFIVNPSFPFQTYKTQMGPNGSPFWCSWGLF